MSVGLKLVNFDKLFQSVTTEKFILNDLDIFNNENKKIFDSYLMKNFSEDNISIIPSCSCGNIKGTYYVGDFCNDCKTYVKNSFEDNVSFLLWLKRPEGVEKFISPIVLNILAKRYSITKPTTSIIHWLLLPNLKFKKLPVKNNMNELERITVILESLGIKRGYNSFVQNLPTIIEVLEKEYIKNNKKDSNIINFILENMNDFLSDYIPFPNRVVFTTESNEMGKYVNNKIVSCINVVRRVTGLDVHFQPNTKKQYRIAISLLELGDFYKNYMKEIFFSKPGLIRQHISSTRSHFTARAVITSITNPHSYDEIYIPWSVGCSLLREHILNKLLKRGMIFKEALNYLSFHTRIYSPLLNEIFKELITESVDGIKVLLNRNPSLHRGSILKVRITHIKPDVNDNTISLSLLIVKPLNADFDGDECNLTLIYDKNINELANNFKPHLNILGFDDVNTFTNNIAFPKTVVSTLSNWYRNGE